MATKLDNIRVSELSKCFNYAPKFPKPREGSGSSFLTATVRSLDSELCRQERESPLSIIMFGEKFLVALSSSAMKNCVDMLKNRTMNEMTK
ncbi:hypothetical protein M0R45_033568 [Rubus argutus]|uniref:Uncharacterized protein n=1 Tax=Rubus argutus TaxID=59490 RepID=A0AAW1WK99_RUBAR